MLDENSIIIKVIVDPFSCTMDSCSSIIFVSSYQLNNLNCALDVSFNHCVQMNITKICEVALK